MPDEPCLDPTLPLLTLAEACRRLPTRPAPATMWRWRVRGVNGVRLACVRVGSRWYTTEKAMTQFIAQQTAAKCSPHAASPAPGRSAATRQRLREAGLE